MSQAAAPRKMTFAEYVRFDEQAELKHQLVGGEVFAMAGGTVEHALLIANVARELGNRVKSPCLVFSSELRVRVVATGLATYPDVPVVCGPVERDPEDKNTVTNPTVIVEVLSDGTEAFDRGDKFHHYRQIASLAAYVLVSQHEARIEVFRRNDDGSWTLEEATGEARIDALGCTLSVEAVYAGVFEAGAAS